MEEGALAPFAHMRTHTREKYFTPQLLPPSRELMRSRMGGGGGGGKVRHTRSIQACTQVPHARQHERSSRDKGEKGRGRGRR